MKKMLFSLVLLIINTAITSAQSTKLDNMKSQINQTITNIFAGTDARDWQRVEKAFANTVLLDYTSMAGGEPAQLTPQQITTAWKGLLPGFVSTHHQIGNFNIQVNGNEATATNHGVALHYLPTKNRPDFWTVYGTYDFKLEQTDGAWKVTAMRFNFKGQDGNLELPKLAAANAQNKIALPQLQNNATAQKVVEEFFSALEANDIQRFMKVWAEDATQIMPFAPDGFPQQLRGKDAIYNQYKGLPENYNGMKFPRRLFTTADPNVIIVQYNGIIGLKTGGDYNNIYVGVFQLENDKIKQFTEYFDPIILQNAFGTDLNKNFNVQDNDKPEKVHIRKVEFMSEGLVLKGNLYLPANFKSGVKYPAIVIAGSWTTVKEQMAGLYAQHLANQGYVTLAFDFRNYGESEGAPRFYESPALKIQDLRNAVSFLETQPEVDKTKIAALGVCAGSGYVLEATAADSRIRAAATVAAWLHDGEAVKMVYGGAEGVQQRIQAARAAKQQFATTGEIAYIPTISATDSHAAMYGPFDYYLNAERGAIPQWSADKFAVMSWEDWLTFNPMPTAKNIKVPTMMIHSDGAVLPGYTKQFFQNIPVKDKELVWTEGTQFDFYDQPKQVNEAVAKVSAFFGKHLQ